MVMTRIVGWFFEKVIGGPLATFGRANARPFATQEALLRRILRENADTEFGARFSFRRIGGLSGAGLWKTFRRDVPVQGYADFLPSIEKMKAGAENILVPGRPEMFSLSSGSGSGAAGAPKFCPVTDAFIKEYARQHLLWMYHIYEQHPMAGAGKILVLASPAEIRRTGAGIACGALSGKMLADHLPAPSRQRMAAPATAILELPDAGDRWFNTLLFAMTEENLRVVAALNPGALVALAKHLDRDAERLLDHMEKGHTGGESAGLPGMYAPDPARAKKLRDILRVNGALTPADVWPDLELLLTWQGGASKFFLPHVTALWGDIPMRCPGLRSSEGVFSIPLRDNDASGILAVDSHVMEFLPVGDSDGDACVVKTGAQTLLAGQLEEGRLYRLIVTTQGGLYRYDTGDLLRVTGFRGRTPEVRFERAAGSFLSAAGAKVTEDQIVSAMEIAAANGPLLNGFTCTFEPVDSGGERCLLALECTGGSDLSGGSGKRLRARLEDLLSVFDYELMKNNPGYNERRQDGRLVFPRMVLLAEGSYEALHARRAAEGRPESQIKQPTLAAPGGAFFDYMPIAAEL